MLKLNKALLKDTKDIMYSINSKIPRIFTKGQIIASKTSKGIYFKNGKDIESLLTFEDFDNFIDITKKYNGIDMNIVHKHKLDTTKAFFFIHAMVDMGILLFEDW